MPKWKWSSESFSRRSFPETMAVRRGGMKVADLLKVLSGSSGIDRLLKPVQVITSSEGQCVCEMKVDESHLNLAGTLHGGFTATLVDSISTLAIMTACGKPGVSVDMNISYLNAVRAEDILEIRSDVIKKGNKLAFATVDVIRKSDNQLVAVGRQTKYL